MKLPWGRLGDNIDHPEPPRVYCGANETQWGRHGDTMGGHWDTMETRWIYSRRHGCAMVTKWRHHGPPTRQDECTMGDSMGGKQGIM